LQAAEGGNGGIGKDKLRELRREEVEALDEEYKVGSKGELMVSEDAEVFVVGYDGKRFIVVWDEELVFGKL
jgi:hypothetical protein